MDSTASCQFCISHCHNRCTDASKCRSNTLKQIRFSDSIQLLIGNDEQIHFHSIHVPEASLVMDHKPWHLHPDIPHECHNLHDSDHDSFADHANQPLSVVRRCAMNENFDIILIFISVLTVLRIWFLSIKYNLLQSLMMMWQFSLRIHNHNGLKVARLNFVCRVSVATTELHWKHHMPEGILPSHQIRFFQPSQVCLAEMKLDRNRFVNCFPMATPWMILVLTQVWTHLMISQTCQAFRKYFIIREVSRNVADVWILKSATCLVF